VALPDLIETNQEAADQAGQMRSCGRSVTRFEPSTSVARLLESGHGVFLDFQLLYHLRSAIKRKTDIDTLAAPKVLG